MPDPNQVDRAEYALACLERDEARAALRTLWDDLRFADKHNTSEVVLATVRGVIGHELDSRDPAYRPPAPDPSPDFAPGGES